MHLEKIVKKDVSKAANEQKFPQALLLAESDEKHAEKFVEVEKGILNEEWPVNLVEKAAFIDGGGSEMLRLFNQVSGSGNTGLKIDFNRLRNIIKQLLYELQEYSQGGTCQ